MRAIFLGILVVAATAITTTSSAEVRPIRPAPFDFSVKEKRAEKAGLLRRLLHYVDGGDLRGFPSIDPSVRRSENGLHALTIRYKGQF